jgi:hypothetical protein
VVVPPTAYYARVWIDLSQSAVLRIGPNRQTPGWIHSKVLHYDIRCGNAKDGITAQQGAGWPNTEHRQRSGKKVGTIADLELPMNLLLQWHAADRLGDDFSRQCLIDDV